MEEESKRLRNELSEEKARHKFDVDKVTTAKEEELEEVHKRFAYKFLLFPSGLVRPLKSCLVLKFLLFEFGQVSS